MNDPLAGYNDSLTSPARQAYTITPDDDDELPIIPKCICVSAGGDITLRAMDSTQDVVLTVQAGQLLPVRAAYVRASGTTATGLVALA